MHHRRAFNLAIARLLAAVEVAREHRTPWAAAELQRTADRSRRALQHISPGLLGRLSPLASSAGLSDEDAFLVYQHVSFREATRPRTPVGGANHHVSEPEALSLLKEAAPRLLQWLRRFEAIVSRLEARAEGGDPSAAELVETIYLLIDIKHALLVWLPQADYLITGSYDPDQIAREHAELTLTRSKVEPPIPHHAQPLVLLPQIQPTAPNPA